MGECLIVRRGGESYELPVLSASYPRDVTVTAAAGASASFSISITTPGRPAEYTYQWYRNGAAVSGVTAAIATSIIESSGSKVVNLCIHSPGWDTIRDSTPWERPAHFRIS